MKKNEDNYKSYLYCMINKIYTNFMYYTIFAYSFIGDNYNNIYNYIYDNNISNYNYDITNKEKNITSYYLNNTYYRHFEDYTKSDNYPNDIDNKNLFSFVSLNRYNVKLDVTSLINSFCLKKATLDFNKINNKTWINIINHYLNENINSNEYITWDIITNKVAIHENVHFKISITNDFNYIVAIENN